MPEILWLSKDRIKINASTILAPLECLLSSSQKNTERKGAWVALSVKLQTLAFGSGCDLGGRGSVLSRESVRDSLSSSASAPPPLSLK